MEPSNARHEPRPARHLHAVPDLDSTPGTRAVARPTARNARLQTLMAWRPSKDLVVHTIAVVVVLGVLIWFGPRV